jgi:nitrogen fixation NifU-like protein
MSLESQYSNLVLKHFKKPHNCGVIKDADGVGVVGNPVCGDVMKLYIKVKESKGKEIIKDIKFETFGCVAAIATSSVITDIVKGKSIDEALKIKKENIVKKLGGLPPIKIHCSLLAVDALNAAIYDYYKKSGKQIPKVLEERYKEIQRRVEH